MAEVRSFEQATDEFKKVTNQFFQEIELHSPSGTIFFPEVNSYTRKLHPPEAVAFLGHFRNFIVSLPASVEDLTAYIEANENRLQFCKHIDIEEECLHCNLFMRARLKIKLSPLGRKE